MITFAEELLLLALDDEKGKFYSMPFMTLEYALVGAILMELALKNRLETDQEHLIIVNDAPTGDALFDKVLQIISQEPKTLNAKFWIREISKAIPNLKDILLERLIAKGIIKKSEHTILWVFSERCYPTLDDKEVKEVRTRIREIVLSDNIPNPRDIALITLLDTCNLIDKIFSKEELERAEKRIEQIAKMDLIGQALSQAVSDVYKMVNLAVAAEPD